MNGYSRRPQKRYEAVASRTKIFAVTLQTARASDQGGWIQGTRMTQTIRTTDANGNPTRTKARDPTRRGARPSVESRLRASRQRGVRATSPANFWPSPQDGDRKLGCGGRSIHHEGIDCVAGSCGTSQTGICSLIGARALYPHRFCPMPIKLSALGQKRTWRRTFPMSALGH